MKPEDQDKSNAQRTANPAVNEAAREVREIRRDSEASLDCQGLLLPFRVFWLLVTKPCLEHFGLAQKDKTLF